MLGKYRQHCSKAESSASPTLQAPPPKYPRHPQDIRSTLHWLHRASRYRLPEEILTVILHQANYDCLHFVANSDRLETARAYGPVDCTAKPYVQTPPIKFLKDGIHQDWTGRVRRLTLKAKGQDQGWTSEKGSDSWSWFDVGRTKLAQAVALEGGGDKVRRGPCWARNPVAGKDWKVHEKMFDVDEMDNEEMKDWIESLENGHRVSIVPMARFDKWECQVIEGSVDVEVEIWR